MTFAPSAGNWDLQDSGQSGTFLIRRDGTELFEVTLPEERDVEGFSQWVKSLSPAGDELWILGRHHLELLRFALPE